MSDNLSLTMRVTAHDDASPVLKKIAGEIDRLNDKLRKTVGDAKRAASGSIAGSPNQTKTKPHSTSEFARETADAAKQLKLKFTGIGKVAALQRREAGSIAKAQAAADRAAIAALKAKIQGTAKVVALRIASEKSVADEADKADKAGIAALRTKLATMARMARQRLNEERLVASEQARTAAAAERDHAASLRSKIQGQRYLFRLRQTHERELERDRETNRADLGRYSRAAGGHARDAVGRFARTTTAVGAAGAAGTGALVRRSLGAESDIDSAEVNAQIYGGLSKDAARKLRDQWAAPMAEALGTGTDKLLTAWVDATKLGIPASGASAFAELSTKVSEAWSVPFETVTDTLGTVNTILTSKGEKFDANRLKSVANTLQHLAAKQSTTPEKLISFMQRGAGASQVLGMSQEAGLAFGSASTSLGNQAGQSGRMFDYVASRLIEMPRLVKKHGDEGKQARDLVKHLGFGSADQMDRARRADPDAFLPDLMERFSKIRNPKDQERAIRFFTGREWLGEFGRMVKGIETYKEAAKLSQEAKGLDAIGKVWDLHKLKLAFVFKQFKSGWLNILGEFGKVLSPMARQAGDYFLAWSENLRSGGLADRFKAAITGFIEGLGFKDLPDLLKGVFGEPGKGDAGSIRAWGDAARGFGAGLRDVGSAIASFFRVFTGGDTSPEIIGRWTGRILALSAALVVLSPVIGVLGSLASGLLALGLAAGAAWRILQGLGIVGGGAKPPSPARPVGPATGAGGGLASRILGSLSKIAVPFAAATTTSQSQADKDKLALRLGKYAKDHSPAVTDPAKPATPPSPVRAWQDPPASLRKADTDTKAIVQRVVPAIPATSADPTALPSTVTLAVGDLHERMKAILNAFLDRLEKLLTGLSVNGATIRTTATSEVAETVRAMGARLQLAALGAGGSAVSGLGSSSVGSGSSSSSSLSYVTGGGSAAGSRLSSFGGRVSGNGITAPMLRGEAAANAKTAFDFFKSKGLSTEAASGILASMKQESGFNPQARGDGGRAHGLFQHHPDRRAAIQRATGIDMSTASVAKQLEGAWWEMNHGDAGAQRALRILKQSGISARDAGGAFVQHFERPARDERASRGAMAEGFSREFGGGPAITGTGNVLADMQRLKQTGRVLNDQCVSLAKAAVGATGSVTEWQKGVGAEAGTLKPGTPVATFLDRMGRQSERYAGGGIGTMGAKLDHAGVFERYITDAAGKRIGMRIAEQYRGSGGVRSKAYLFGRGFGEGNGSNYHAVLGPDGQPLGGDRNPMSLARQAAAPTPESLAKAAEGSPISRMGDSMMGRNGGPGGGNGASITAPITINHHGDSAQLANQVQNRIQEARNWQSRDQDFQSV